MASLKWNPIDAQGINPQASLQGFMAGLGTAADATQALADNEQKNNILIQNQLRENNASLAEYLKSQETPFDFAGAQSLWTLGRQLGYSGSELGADPEFVKMAGVKDKAGYDFLNKVEQQYTSDWKAQKANEEAIINAEYEGRLAALDKEKEFFSAETYDLKNNELKQWRNDALGKHKASMLPSQRKDMSPSQAVLAYRNKQLTRNTTQEIEDKATQQAPKTESTKSPFTVEQKKAKSKQQLKTPSNVGFSNAVVGDDGLLVVSDYKGNIYPFSQEDSKNIIEAADEFNLPPEFLGSVFGYESSGKANAVSETGAIGLAQMFPAALTDVMETYGDQWVAKFGEVEPDRANPAHAAWLGTAYLATLRDRYGVANNPLDLYLAYNLGSGGLKDGKQVGSKELRKFMNDPNQDQNQTIKSLGLWNEQLANNPNLYTSSEMTLNDVRNTIKEKLGITDRTPAPNDLLKASTAPTDVTSTEAQSTSVGKVRVPGQKEAEAVEGIMQAGIDVVGVNFSTLRMSSDGVPDANQAGHVAEMRAGMENARERIAALSDVQDTPDINLDEVVPEFMLKNYFGGDMSALSERKGFYLLGGKTNQDAIKSTLSDLKEALGKKAISETELREIFTYAFDSNGDGAFSYTPEFNKTLLHAGVKAVTDKKLIKEAIRKERRPIVQALEANLVELDSAITKRDELAKKLARMPEDLSGDAQKDMAKQLMENEAAIIRFGNEVTMGAGQLKRASEIEKEEEKRINDERTLTKIREDQNSLSARFTRWASDTASSFASGKAAPKVVHAAAEAKSLATLAQKANSRESQQHVWEKAALLAEEADSAESAKYKKELRKLVSQAEKQHDKQDTPESRNKLMAAQGALQAYLAQDRAVWDLRASARQGRPAPKETRAETKGTLREVVAEAKEPPKETKAVAQRSSKDASDFAKYVESLNEIPDVVKLAEREAATDKMPVETMFGMLRSSAGMEAEDILRNAPRHLRRKLTEEEKEILQAKSEELLKHIDSLAYDPTQQIR